MGSKEGQKSASSTGPRLCPPRQRTISAVFPRHPNPSSTSSGQTMRREGSAPVYVPRHSPVTIPRRDTDQTEGVSALRPPAGNEQRNIIYTVPRSQTGSEGMSSMRRPLRVDLSPDVSLGREAGLTRGRTREPPNVDTLFDEIPSSPLREDREQLRPTVLIDLMNQDHQPPLTGYYPPLSINDGGRGPTRIIHL